MGISIFQLKSPLGWSHFAEGYRRNQAPTVPIAIGTVSCNHIFQEKFRATKNPVNPYGYWVFLWSHLESNQAPTDYESVALTE